MNQRQIKFYQQVHEGLEQIHEETRAILETYSVDVDEVGLELATELLAAKLDDLGHHLRSWARLLRRIEPPAR